MDEQEQRERQELLEIYKLHAELADRVSQRRDGVSRLYVSLLVGLLVFAATVLKFGTDGNNGISADAVLLGTGALGILLAVSWLMVIKSYRELNAGKFIVLQKLESGLPYQFFTKQFKLSPEEKKISPYWKYSSAAANLPWIWFVAFSLLAIFALFRLLACQCS